MALAQLFNMVLERGHWPAQWRRAYLLPLFKGQGSKISPSNYRMLAIGSVVAKVMEKIIDVRLRRWSDRVGALCDLQGGFREGRGTIDQIFLLNEIVAKRAEEGQCTLLAFVDVQKAYDRVWKPGLLAKLYASGVGGKCFSLLKDILAQVSRVVSLNGCASDEFKVDSGVPQGSVLSPWLYAVFINDLYRDLVRAGVGISIYGKRVPLLLYADDLVLLARDKGDLRKMLAVLDAFARRWRFSVNNDKSGIVVAGADGRISLKRSVVEEMWTLGGQKVQVVPNYKYLGLEFTERRATGR